MFTFPRRCRESDGNVNDVNDVNQREGHKSFSFSFSMFLRNACQEVQFQERLQHFHVEEVGTSDVHTQCERGFVKPHRWRDSYKGIEVV